VREDSPLKTVECVCIHETDKAIRIEPPEYVKPENKADDIGKWIPKSQIHPTSQVNIRGDVGNLIISEWIFQQKEKENDKGWNGYNHD